jgi:UDP-N-acetylglucosamine:LPS N-acetylglucosamine transferase
VAVDLPFHSPGGLTVITCCGLCLKNMYLCTCVWQISEAYERYKPDLVVSVHPLMQGVPLRVLKQRIKAGLQDPINFATVVTDFTTCHNTWFDKYAHRFALQYESLLVLLCEL